jgi:hypothetical protein
VLLFADEDEEVCDDDTCDDALDPTLKAGDDGAFACFINCRADFLRGPMYRKKGRGRDYYIVRIYS